MADDLYVKVCPNCGGTNINITPQATNLASGPSGLVGSYCLDCQFSGIFPEMKASNVTKFAKEISKKVPLEKKPVYYAETKKERSFYYVNKIFGKHQKIFWIINGILYFAIPALFYISGHKIIASVYLVISPFAMVIVYGRYKESSKYAARGAYK